MKRLSSTRLFGKTLPARKIIPLAAFGALMLGAVPVNWAFIRAESGKLGLIDTGLERIAKGKVAEEVTAKYNASSPFKDAGIEAFGALSYFAFGEARSGAQVGANGVLFSNEEFETGADSPAAIARAIGHIATVKDVLASKGVALIIAPLPLKATVAEQELGALRLPEEPAARYGKVRASLTAAGIASIDLEARFRAVHAETRVFLAADTHWTAEGAAIAAEAIAASPLARDLPGQKSFMLTSGAPVEHPGDLRKFIRLPAWLEAFGPAHDRISPVEAKAADEGADLFGDAAAPVVLVGTSYSANPAFGFEAHLKGALQRDVLNFAEEGKGPFAPMMTFLKSDVLRDQPPKLVIWEIPVRYMDDAYPAEQFTLPAVLP
jgi:alginate O-acetyltransferase complex protein AlgJ